MSFMRRGRRSPAPPAAADDLPSQQKSKQGSGGEKKPSTKHSGGVLICTTGCPGEGKTEACQAMARILREQISCVLDLSIDQVRYGLYPELRDDKDEMARDFTADELARSYNGMCFLFDEMLRMNPDNVLIGDGVFRTKGQRDKIRRIAAKHDVKFVFLRVRASEGVVIPRLVERLATWKGSGPKNYLCVREIYDEPKGDDVVCVDNDGDLDRLQAQLRQILADIFQSDDFLAESDSSDDDA